jgi:lipase chaperone LimK
MKNFITTMLIFACSVFSSQAQEQPPRDKMRGEQKMKALYIAYITQEMKLTEDEATKFWPIHLQYDNELKELHRQQTPELEKEEAVLNVKKKYKDRFSKVIGNERTQDFFRKDKEFRIT